MHLVHDRIEAECAYLNRQSALGFERPYGWAWALMLAGELARHETDEGRRWAAALNPLADAFVRRFEEFFPLMIYPVRVGAHSNTAFALLLALNFSKATGNVQFAELCKRKARKWYANDADCQAWEPSGEDFLSPALVEAACLGVVMSRDEFAGWFARYLPNAADGKPETLFAPATVTDRTDGQIGHLDGLKSGKLPVYVRF